jgi:hypothetical protein
VESQRISGQVRSIEVDHFMKSLWPPQGHHCDREPPRANSAVRGVGRAIVSCNSSIGAFSNCSGARGKAHCTRDRKRSLQERLYTAEPKK